MAYYTSGDTPLATSGDAAINVLTVGGDGQQLRFFCLTHTTANVPFELSFDGGTTWLPCNSGATGASVNLKDQVIQKSPVKLRRIPGGTDITGIYAWGE